VNASIAVAVSGGRDSIALLHCLVHASVDRGVDVWALHVHHGLQSQASAWAEFVRRTCARWAKIGLPLQFAMRFLDGRPARGQSVEAWARAGRYDALTAMARDAGCSAVALAHHRGDQAETFLLQALRGAGPAGLASMPARVERNGILWLRPWLDQPREAIEAYVRCHRLRYVDDASNADRRFARSRLRSEVMPTMIQAFPDAEVALAQAARHAARARALIDEIAMADLESVRDGHTLMQQRWLALSPVRRYEVLRAWLASHADAGVRDALLERLLRELPGSGPAQWPFDQFVLKRYRGRITLTEAARRTTSDPWPCSACVDHVGLHDVPGTSASLRVRLSTNDGLPLVWLKLARWQERAGAERFQCAAGTPPRSLKKQFQAAGVPAWSRDAPLLVAADGRLIFVPGLGTDARALTAPGSPRVTLEWICGR
jgi:tRNA(Ile)-lysidine synthase